MASDKEKKEDALQNNTQSEPLGSTYSNDRDETNNDEELQDEYPPKGHHTMTGWGGDPDW